MNYMKDLLNKYGRNKPNTSWTPAFQSYYSAGDEAEEFCANCETYVEDDFNYCPGCGIKLIREPR